MEKYLCLFIFMYSALLEVKALECYVCDNCPTVKLDQIQTCGPSIVSGSSTTTAKPESPTTTTNTANLQTISTPTTSKPTTISTNALPEATTISSNINIEVTTLTKATEATSTSTTTTDATTSLMTEIGSIFTESTTPVATFSTAAMKPTNTLMMIPLDPLTTSTVTSIPISSLSSTAIEPQTIATPKEDFILIAPMNTTNVTVTTPGSPIIFEELTNTFTETVPEPMMSSASTIGEPSAIGTAVPFISTLPTTTVASIATFSTTGSKLESNSAIFDQKTEPTIQNIPLLSTSTSAPVLNFTAKIPMTSAVNYQESTVDNIRPNGATNVRYNSRRIRSSSEDCVCKGELKCDCSITHQRAKRYTLRGLGLSKEAVKYVCFVDKFKINETEIVKRGCAIKEDNEKAACAKLGFGGDCKVCDNNQCNSATIVQSSVLLLFMLYLI